MPLQRGQFDATRDFYTIRKLGRLQRMRITIDVDMDDALALVGEHLPNAVPYVRNATLAGLAKRVQGRIVATLPSAFDRPTPFTMRGVFVRNPRGKNDPTAQVYFPQSEDRQGRGQREYMRPGAKGASARRQKRTEYLLTRQGWLPPGWVTTPGKGAQLNSFGNLEGRIYRQIINVLQIRVGANLKAISSASQKRAARLGVSSEYFAVPPGTNRAGPGGSWLPPGVYRHTKGRSKPMQILKFVKRATYRPRLQMEAIARAEIRREGAREFARAWSTVTQRFAARSKRA